MLLTLHFHPLSSFCHKALIALYENDTPFTPKLVNLQDEGERSAFRALWPIGKFPVLEDAARDRMVPESSIIIEYLDRHYPGKTRFLPDDPDLARQTRLRDRFLDLHVHMQMQKIVGDRLRRADKKDPYGVGRNFGHVAYEVDDIYASCQRFIAAGYPISRPPRDGRMAFIRSPDLVSVELLQRGAALAPAEPWTTMPNVGEW